MTAAVRLGKALRRVRVVKGRGLAETARRLHWAPGRLVGVEEGRLPIAFVTAGRLLDALDADIGDLTDAARCGRRRGGGGGTALDEGDSRSSVSLSAGQCPRTPFSFGTAHHAGRSRRPARRH